VLGLLCVQCATAADESESTLEEVLVTATRQPRRIADEPIRVEVLDHEELEEKIAASPGDVSQVLNETPGLRIQQISPGLGAVNIRIEGLRGRYSQILSDGLPLFGGQSNGTSLLQIPPLDLGQVEVLKGVSSALYGASALGGVINFVSRRPDGAHDLVLNQTNRNETDASLWWSGEPATAGWSYSALANLNRQSVTDLNNDGWADLPGFKRTSIRPRLYWKGEGRNDMFITAGIMTEDRRGGTIDGGRVPPGDLNGAAFIEADNTHRYDTGFAGHWAMADALTLTVKASDSENTQHQTTGADIETSHTNAALLEVAFDGAVGSHSWVAGLAFEQDRYRNSTFPVFDFQYSVPAVFAQDEYTISPSLTLSTSARVDHHSRYGTILSPRWALLWRPRGKSSVWRVRTSYGTGFFAPTPLTEETEATGLERIMPLGQLRAERAQGFSVDFNRVWKLQRGSVEANLTVFHSSVANAVNLIQSSAAPARFAFTNDPAPTYTFGTELLVQWRSGPLALIVAHGYVDSTEFPADAAHRGTVPLNPRHTGTFTMTWENPSAGRIGLESFYVGHQALTGAGTDNPYRTTSPSYVLFGVSIQREVGPLTAFLNFENLTDRRMTRFQPLLLPQQASDGRWTVDAWGPLDGREINLGVRWRMTERD